MSSAPGYFLTGTDTGVGKTRVACALVREWRHGGLDAVGLKPIACGDRDDALALHEAAERSISLEAINPLWFTTPAAPYVAAAAEGRAVDLEVLTAAVLGARHRHACVLVEGAGGWRVPLTRSCDLGDLAAALGLPVLVVAANRLGAINHTRLTVEAILARGLHCSGVILNHPHAEDDAAAFISKSNLRTLAELLPVPILGSLRHGGEAIEWSQGPLSPNTTL